MSHPLDRPIASDLSYASDYRLRVKSTRPRTKRLAAFFSRVQRDAVTGCWNWTGRRAGGGKNYSYYAYGTGHTVSYSWFVGPIPQGLQIDHLCRNTLCVNPAHLEAVTPQENHRRHYATLTHCKQGHPRSIYWRAPGPNAKRKVGKCSACGRKWSQNYEIKMRGDRPLMQPPRNKKPDPIVHHEMVRS